MRVIHNDDLHYWVHAGCAQGVYDFDLSRLALSKCD